MLEPQKSLLAKMDLLSDLSAEEITKIDKVCAWKNYSTNEQIIDRYSDSRNIFFVVQGKVRIVNHSLSGREIAFDDIVEGNYFGELSALDEQPRSASVIALTKTQVASMPSKIFIQMICDHPSVALKVIMRLTKIVRTSTGRIMELSTLGANNRVHAELLRQAREGEIGVTDNSNVAIIKPIPIHNDIASRVSTTRETVARVMGDLARQKIIERRADSLAIIDFRRLENMVEEVCGE